MNKQPPPRPRNVNVLLGRQPAAKPAVVATKPAAPLPEKAKPKLAPETPSLPEGRNLGPIGIIVWSKLCKTLEVRGNWSDDYKESLFTLCSLEECAAELREEFLNELTVDTKAGKKMNPVIGEWTKMVTLLRAYYAEFALTPKSAAPPGSGAPNSPKIPPVGSRRDMDSAPGPAGKPPQGLFDPAD